MKEDIYTATKSCWKNMKSRCTNPKIKDFKNYGGRGISFCDRWSLFTNFIEDMGLQPRGLQLDRIKVDGNYTKSNCRWVSCSRNAMNRRSTSRSGHKHISNHSLGGYLFRLKRPGINHFKYFRTLTEALEYKRKYFLKHKYSGE